MKPFSVIIQVLLAASLVIGEEEVQNCICIQNYDPVCGKSDGIFSTYSNLCYFQCAQKANPSITLFSHGECPAIEKVSEIEDTQIDLEREKNTCICSMDYKPVCSANPHRTYANICFLNCARFDNPALEVAHEGECNEKMANLKADYVVPRKGGCVCTREYRPVCASNRKTYPNPCEMRCAAEELQTILRIVHYGECSD